MAKLFLGTREVSDVFKLTNTQTLNITPTTSAQIITAAEGTGYSPVNVSAVTSAIDSNITTGNIKKDVTILGVTGSYEIPGVKEGIQREVNTQGKIQMPTTSFTFSLPSNATDVGSNAMQDAFYNCTGLTSVDLSSLTTVSGSRAMRYAFQNCTGLTSVDLSSLTTVSGSQAMYGAFWDCKKLTTLSFPALTSTSFGSYTNQFNGMLQGVTGCTVHFPSNLQSVIGSWSSVTAGFGGTNTTVLFDLPATI